MVGAEAGDAEAAILGCEDAAGAVCAGAWVSTDAGERGSSIIGASHLNNAAAATVAANPVLKDLKVMFLERVMR